MSKQKKRANKRIRAKHKEIDDAPLRYVSTVGNVALSSKMRTYSLAYARNCGARSVCPCTSFGAIEPARVRSNTEVTSGSRSSRNSLSTLVRLRWGGDVAALGRRGGSGGGSKQKNRDTEGANEQERAQE